MAKAICTGRETILGIKPEKIKKIWKIIDIKPSKIHIFLLKYINCGETLF